MSLSGTFDENRALLDEIFKNCDDISKLDLELRYSENSRGKIYFVEEAVSNITIRKVIWGLTDVEELKSIEDIKRTVLSGNAVLIVEGNKKSVTGLPGTGILNEITGLPERTLPDISEDMQSDTPKAIQSDVSEDMQSETPKAIQSDVSEDMQSDIPKAIQSDTPQGTQKGCTALKIRGTGYPGIGINEAKDEQVVRGSSEGFSVSYKTNTVLVRKRIRSSSLKVEEVFAGVSSDTGIAVLYMDGIARKKVLEEVKSRLKSFRIDGFMDSGVIEQLTDGEEWSPFPQYMTTVRPDRAAQFLLDGHIVLLIDNSPVALVLPVNMGSFMKTADDYYEKWAMATFQRILRYIAIFFAISLPALYISVVNFHPEILPNNLIQVFIKARQAIPYPVFVEVMIMEIAFELIREAGVRVPGAMGNAIGVVGGLIVGSAAVDASLASPIIVVIVALTAMCSFAIPNNEFSSAFRLIKYFLIIMSEIYGIFGYLTGILLIMLHLSGLTSFGFPYLGPVAASEINGNEDRKDFVVRMPYRFLTSRPIFSGRDNRKKLSFHVDEARKG